MDRKPADAAWQAHLRAELPHAKVTLRAVVESRRVSTSDVLCWRIGSDLAAQLPAPTNRSNCSATAFLCWTRNAEKDGRIALHVETRRFAARTGRRQPDQSPEQLRGKSHHAVFPAERRGLRAPGHGRAAFGPAARQAASVAARVGRMPAGCCRRWMPRWRMVDIADGFASGCKPVSGDRRGAPGRVAPDVGGGPPPTVRPRRRHLRSIGCFHPSIAAWRVRG